MKTRSPAEASPSTSAKALLLRLPPISLPLMRSSVAAITPRVNSIARFQRSGSRARRLSLSFISAALETSLTPDTVRADAPINVKGWEPENYSAPIFWSGHADQSSVAIPQHRGGAAWPRSRSQGRRRGRRTGLASHPSFRSIHPSRQLGTSEVTPLEIVSAYAAFANGGIGVQPQIISRVKTASGKLLYQRKVTSNGRSQSIHLCGDDERHDARNPAHRHGAQGVPPGLASGRKNRHEPGFSRRLVHWLYEPSCHWRLARQ